LAKRLRAAGERLRTRHKDPQAPRKAPGAAVKRPAAEPGLPGPPRDGIAPTAREAAPAQTGEDVRTDQVFKPAPGGPVPGAPARIGPYRVMKKIGAGGFGLVLEATRDDTFQKRVAIKLLQRGAVSEETLKRFERERQVMAAMNHPNIARLLEGGKTDDG